MSSMALPSSDSRYPWRRTATWARVAFSLGAKVYPGDAGAIPVSLAQPTARAA